MKIDLWNGWYSNYPETNHQVFSHPYIRENKGKVVLTISRAKLEKNSSVNSSGGVLYLITGNLFDKLYAQRVAGWFIR